jgi:anti-sigma factor RsiW
MKNTEQLLDLQAYVDGELSEERRRQVEAALPVDLDAQELVAGLQQLGSLIRAHEPAATVPASREFYWSQIRRQIEAEQPKAPAASVALGWLRWLIPAMGVAAVAVVVSTQQAPREITLAGGGDVTVVDVSSTVFRSESDGVTVHWIQ